ncbi:MAG: hypothetical protein ACOYNL_03945 [Rickettsiales bacterium]
MQRKVIDFALMWLETISVVGFLMLPGLAFIAGCMSGGFLSGLLGMLIATIVSVVIFGGVFLLIQNNQTLKDIRSLMQAKSGL